MTSTYHQYSSFSPFPIDLNEDQHHLFSSKSSEDASSFSSISYPIFINPPQQQLSGYYHREFQPLQHQQEANTYASQGGSSWDQPTLKNDENKLPAVCKKQDIINIEEDHDQRDNTNTNTSSVKWMSSKMRLMRKMMSSDQAVAGAPETYMHKFEDDKNGSSPLQDDNSMKKISNNTNNSIRVCADCNTTKTPLWRSGTKGPKSLCNACGIRQRKARRALAAAQASANGKIFAPETANTKNNKVQNKERKTSNNNNNNSHLPFKKRCRFTAQGRGRKNKLCFEDYLSIMLSKNSAFHQQVFPQDEIQQAAILLMALSYGLVHG